MCQKCADALNEHFGSLTDKQKMDVLWAGTAFPAGCGDTCARQLAELSKKSGGDYGLAMKIADDETTQAMQSDTPIPRPEEE